MIDRTNPNGLNRLQWSRSFDSRREALDFERQQYDIADINMDSGLNTHIGWDESAKKWIVSIDKPYPVVTLRVDK